MSEIITFTDSGKTLELGNYLVTMEQFGGSVPVALLKS